MKKYWVLGLLALGACKDKDKIHYVCLTPFGVGQIDLSNPDVQERGRDLLLTQENQYVLIPKSLCVEVIEK